MRCRKRPPSALHTQVPRRTSDSTRSRNRREDELSRERAIATVGHGRNAENLLDLSEDATEEVNGLANTLAMNVAASASTGANTLDDLLGLFDTTASVTAAQPSAPLGRPPGLATSVGAGRGLVSTTHVFVAGNAADPSHKIKMASYDFFC